MGMAGDVGAADYRHSVRVGDSGGELMNKYLVEFTVTQLTSPPKYKTHYLKRKVMADSPEQAERLARAEVGPAWCDKPARVLEEYKFNPSEGI